MNTNIVSLRLEESTLKALNTLAHSIDRPKTYLIRKAVETYLEEYADYQIALDRLNNPSDTIVSKKELKKRLGF